MSRVSSWVRADYHFLTRRAVVRVAAPVLLEHPGWSALLEAADIDALGAALTRLLVLANGGQYAGGQVLALVFDAHRACWDLTIVHPTLTPVAYGARAPEVTLTVTNALMQQALEDD